VPEKGRDWGSKKILANNIPKVKCSGNIVSEIKIKRGGDLKMTYNKGVTCVTVSKNLVQSACRW